MKLRAVIFDCLGVFCVPANGGLVQNEALLGFAQKLRTTHKVGLLTNLSAGSLDKYFTHAEQMKYFDGVVVSSEAGAAKPSLSAYKQMAAKLGVSTSECVLVDDSQLNCNGAVKAGMQAVLCQSSDQVIRDIQRLLQ